MNERNTMGIKNTLTKMGLLFLLIVSPVYADSLGFNIGFGQRTTTFYGIDYQVNANDAIISGLPYMDFGVHTNKDYVQPTFSLGLQWENINIGVASALIHWVFSFGPELGYTYNLNPLVYVKLNNSYLGTPGSQFNYSATTSIGLNF